MKKSRIMCLALVLATAFSLLCGCAKTQTEKTEHEPITMMSPFRNMSAFIDAVHEKYPEINIEVIPYSGANYTAYVEDQYRAGDLPDIYCTTFYVPKRNDMSDMLVDLSTYDFTDRYAEARLRDVNDDGAVYMLPSYYDCIGITYNKTLLEENGWALPNSLKELEELAPKVKAAGVNLCISSVQLPGYGFQYLCNIMDTGFLNTPGGRLWQKEFIAGQTTFSGNAEISENLKLLERWKNIGMFDAEGQTRRDSETHKIMAEGNTLFMLGSKNTFTEDESEDTFGLMPYLSEDGTKNNFILNVSRYMGINKSLEQNPQKLEDALHIMDVLSTVEGMKALNSTFSNTSLLPLKDYDVPPEGYYAEIEDQLNIGATAPFIYGGWENIIVPVGEKVLAYIKGEAGLSEIAETFDQNQHLLADNADVSFTTATEKIDNDHCARIVGIAFAKATGADMALISKNKWYKLEEGRDLNLDGVSGNLFALPVTEQEITSILPTGWRGNIETLRLSGAKVKELCETGYDRNGDGKTFPYELVTPEGFTIDDAAVYTVAVAGVTAETEEQGGGLADTGVLGLDAMKEYLKNFDTISEKDIVWSKEQE